MGERVGIRVQAGHLVAFLPEGGYTSRNAPSRFSTQARCPNCPGSQRAFT